MPDELKERVKKFTITPFPYELTVVVSNDIFQSRKKRDRTLGATGVAEDDGTAAFVSTHESWSYAWMFLPEGCDIGNIVHEVNHVIHYLEKFIVADFDKEVNAYFNGYYSREVAKFVYKKEEKDGKVFRGISDSKTQELQRSVGSSDDKSPGFGEG